MSFVIQMLTRVAQQATKGLAAEYGPHQIRVNSLCPLLSGTGLFETFVGIADTPENREKFVGNVPLVSFTSMYLCLRCCAAPR
jgi:NAD(P)-dependent dehydrogenase (short-subunit alcohol dehydrogenase family)